MENIYGAGGTNKELLFPPGQAIPKSIQYSKLYNYILWINEYLEISIYFTFAHFHDGCQ